MNLRGSPNIRVNNRERNIIFSKSRKLSDFLLTHTLHIKVSKNLGCLVSLETNSLDKRS